MQTICRTPRETHTPERHRPAGFVSEPDGSRLFNPQNANSLFKETRRAGLWERARMRKFEPTQKAQLDYKGEMLNAALGLSEAGKAYL